MKYSLTNFVLLGLFSLGFLFLTFSHYDIQNFTSLTKIYLLASYALCALVILIYVFYKKFEIYLPVFPLASFYFISCYISPAFFKYENIISDPISKINNVPYAIEIGFFGIFSMLSSFIIFFKILKNIKKKEFLLLVFNQNDLFVFGIIASISLLFFFYYIEIHLLLSFLSQIKVILIFFCFGILTNFIANNKKIFNIKIILVLFIKTTVLFLELISGSFALPFLLIFLDYIYFCYIKKKFFLTPLVLFFLIFFVIHEGKHQFRSITWQYNDHNSTNSRLIENSNRFIKLYNYRLENEKNFIEKLTNVNQRTYHRLFHSFTSLTIVTEKTPNKIPYLKGYSYEILYSKLIPRIFWKEKPSDTLGNEYGIRYEVLTNMLGPPSLNFIHKRDRTTSWNMPVLNEFYINYGLKGVIFGMAIIGFIYAFITKFFLIYNSSNIEHIVVFYLFVPIFFLESHLSLLFGAIVQSYIFLILISLIYAKLIKKTKSYFK